MAAEDAREVVRSILEQIVFQACVQIDFTVNLVCTLWDNLPSDIKANYADPVQLGSALDRCYPKYTVKDKEVHPKSGEERTNHNTQKHIEHCWTKTRNLTEENYPEFYKNYRRTKFGVDPYGNVVSYPENSGNRSLTKYDVDHELAWARGGKSSEKNFTACQWSANRNVKSDKLLCTLTMGEMQTGVSVAQFNALMEFISTKGKKGSANYQADEAKLFGWLRRPAELGSSIRNFGNATERCVTTGGAPDGQLLWDFLENNFQGETITKLRGEVTAANACAAAFEARAEAAEARAEAVEARAAAAEAQLAKAPVPQVPPSPPRLTGSPDSTSLADRPPTPPRHDVGPLTHRLSHMYIGSSAKKPQKSQKSQNWGIPLKKDGTPNKNYTSERPLNKDGSLNMKYNINKKAKPTSKKKATPASKKKAKGKKK